MDCNIVSEFPESLNNCVFCFPEKSIISDWFFKCEVSKIIPSLFEFFIGNEEFIFKSFLISSWFLAWFSNVLISSFFEGLLNLDSFEFANASSCECSFKLFEKALFGEIISPHSPPEW